MADDVEMTPVEMTPVEAAEPPKADPLSASAAPKVATLKLSPMARKPVPGATTTAALKPGLKLPPKPGLAGGLKLPPKPGMASGLKLPPKPGLKLPTAVLKPGLKLPPKPVIHKPNETIATAPLPKPVAPVADASPAEKPEAVAVPSAPEVQKSAPDPKPAMAASPMSGLKLPTASLKPGLKLPTASLKPGVKLPPKPVIRKPGATAIATPLPKPVVPVPEGSKAEKPIATTTSAVAPSVMPVAVDAQGVGKLPTVAAKAVGRADVMPAVSVSANPNPLEALKSVTQKLKGITQEIPQQAILHKTGIIAEGAMSEAQKEASKHKTARISLSDAMGVAPVKNENAPMKTIRIKRPADISNATKTLTPAPSESPKAVIPPPTETPAPAEGTSASTVTQRKTLKISRPGGAVRPAGKFGIKRPSLATTVVKAPAADGEPVAPATEGASPVADIPDIPEMPAVSDSSVAMSANEGPAWLMTLSTLVQAAACVAMGALAWFLYQNTQMSFF